MLETMRHSPVTLPAPGWELKPVRKSSMSKSFSRDSWKKDSWKKYAIRQQPEWPDLSTVENVQRELALLPPLVSPCDIRALKRELALAVEGKAFVLQGGDCSENFIENTPEKINKLCKTLAQMAFHLNLSWGKPIIKVGRLAGQFAKPRSSGTEKVNGKIYPSYRGDIVNDAALSFKARKPDPRRILTGYAMAQKTLEYMKTIEKSDALSKVHTSHEALLLPYEQGLLRQDHSGGSWYDCSGHMLWIGERTRQPDSAHIELLRGVSNPIGIKVGPEHNIREISELCKILNPCNQAGRLSLITRFGKKKIGDCFPPLVREITARGHRVLWIIDPMHGNTITSKSGYKTRKYEDIVSEIQSFFRIHRQEKTVAGGIHLEMTGAYVTECLGGICNIRDQDLKEKYLTSCDPRLNGKQSIQIARDVAGMA